MQGPIYLIRNDRLEPGIMWHKIKIKASLSPLVTTIGLHERAYLDGSYSTIHIVERYLYATNLPVTERSHFSDWELLEQSISEVRIEMIESCNISENPIIEAREVYLEYVRKAIGRHYEIEEFLRTIRHTNLIRNRLKPNGEGFKRIPGLNIGSLLSN